MLDVLAAGHLCLDIIPTIIADSVDSGAFLAPGRITEVGEAVISGGGSVSNTGLALGKLGAAVRLVGRVGDDHIGELTRRVLGAQDPDIAQHLRVAPGEPASYTIVLSPPGIDRTFLTAPGPNNSFGPEDIPSPLLRQARMLHLGYPPLLSRLYLDGGETLREILANAHAVGASTSLDLCMPDPSRASGKADWRAILARALPEVDVFAPSAEELLFMLSRSRFDHLCTPQADGLVLDRLRVDDVVALAETALELGAQIVVIKAGHRGLYLRTGSLADLCGRGRPADLSAWKNREIWAPAFRVQVVGTTGAGDATVGGFLMAILRGLAPCRAANAAAAVGASNCEAADAVSGVRSWADTLLRMAGDWERLDAAIDANGWRWCESEGVWIGPRDAAA